MTKLEENRATASTPAMKVLEVMYEAEARYLAAGGPGEASFESLAAFFAPDVELHQAQDGADVALTYQHGADRAATVIDQIISLGRRALAVQADSADPSAVTDAVDQTVAELGRLDVLVNNAGVFVPGPLEDVRREDLDHTLNVNVRAPFVAALRNPLRRRSDRRSSGR